MGGTSKQQDAEQHHQSVGAGTGPALTGILGQLQGNLGNTGVTGAETTRSTRSRTTPTALSSRTLPDREYAGELLSGGGATNQAGNVNQNYQDYRNRPTAACVEHGL
jgi:hypothetical protein